MLFRSGRGDGTSSLNCSDTQGKGGALQNKLEECAIMEIDSAHDEGEKRRWETTGEESSKGSVWEEMRCSKDGDSERVAAIGGNRYSASAGSSYPWSVHRGRVLALETI